MSCHNVLYSSLAIGKLSCAKVEPAHADKVAAADCAEVVLALATRFRQHLELVYVRADQDHEVSQE